MTAVPASQAVRDLLDRGPHLAAMQDQARQVGGCERPVRLRGHADRLDPVTGEVERVWSTEGLPDGVQHKACGNRRASRCLPCSRVYQGDAFQLIAAGLRGGKGVSDTVAAHPAIFATFTAPAFGTVHTRVLGRGGKVKPCRVRRDQHDQVCRHGRPLTCSVRHAEDDPLLGQALCVDCFDYAGAVLWNLSASELWRRTIIGVYRQLARLLRRSERQVRAEVSVQYVKAAEYQRRGVVHFHALLRLDAAPPPPAYWPDGMPWRPPYRYDPPLVEYTAQLLEQALRAAAARTAVPPPRRLPRALVVDADELVPAGTPLPPVRLDPQSESVCWGEQLDVRQVQVADVDTLHERGALDRGQVAGYLAKYATKHTEALGVLDRRLRAADLAYLPVNPHTHRLVIAAWLLAGRLDEPNQGERLRRWAHQLGYGGHFLTKSRRYSTTFTALRKARQQWQQRRHLEALAAMDPWQRLALTARGVLRTRWTLVSVGWRLAGDALLAANARADSQAAREAARELAADAA